MPEIAVNLKRKALAARRRLLEMIVSAGGGHTGGSLSVLDVLVVLYHHVMRVDPSRPDAPDRDFFVLSKGHSVEAYYAVLAQTGFLDDETLATYGRYESPLYGHPTSGIPGVELATGALGHGLSAAVGMALASRRLALGSRAFCVLGDGELAEGSVWEAATAASHYRLGNLVAVVDYNGLQISGPVEAVMSPGDIAARFAAFGWRSAEVDGGDMDALVALFDGLSYDDATPTLVIARTTKGAGVSFMEGRAGWHHRLPTTEEAAHAFDELDAAERVLEEQVAGAADAGGKG